MNFRIMFKKLNLHRKIIFFSGEIIFFILFYIICFWRNRIFVAAWAFLWFQWVGAAVVEVHRRLMAVGLLVLSTD